MRIRTLSLALVLASWGALALATSASGGTATNRDGVMGGYGPLTVPTSSTEALPLRTSTAQAAPSTLDPGIAQAPQAPASAASATAASDEQLQAQCAEMLKSWRERKKKPNLTDGEKADLRHFDAIYRQRCM